jgi:4-amino-4-deoxy-L-arabinose transferase-like glycosyltransferase
MTLITWRRTILLAACLFGLAVLVMVLLRPLLPIDETRYLAVAWEMWQGGSKSVPRINGELYSHKPPLLFWLMNIVWLLVGVGDIAARLVAPAFGLASVVLTGVLAWRLWPDAPERAGLAALMVASLGMFLLFGSTTMFDTMLTTATLLSMIALWAMRRAQGLWQVVAFGAALALGVFAKGPVILVHVLPVALLMPLWADRATRPALWSWYRAVGLGVLVALVIVGVWLGPALILGGPEYRTDVLWRQSAGRMVESFAHKRPVWFFVAMLPVFVWPWGWSVNALRALSPRRLIADEATRFVVLWAVAALVGFSLISGKQVHYLLPEMPAMALILSGMAITGLTVWRRLVLVVPALAVAALGVAVYFGFIPQAGVNGAEMPFGVLAMVLAVVAVLVIVVFRLGETLTATALAAPATLIALHMAAYPTIWAGYDPSVIAAVVASGQDKGVATTDTGYAGQFSFSGRLDQPVTKLYDPEALTAWMAAHPGGTVILRDKESVEQGLELVFRREFHGKDYRITRVQEASP